MLPVLSYYMAAGNTLGYCSAFYLRLSCSPYTRWFEVMVSTSLSPLGVLLIGCHLLGSIADAKVRDNNHKTAHGPGLLALIHQGFTLAAKRGHNIDKEGGKVVVRYIRLDDEHTFLSAVPIGMKTAATVVQENIAESGMWSPGETTVLKEILVRNCGNPDKPQVLVDVGCNIGWFCSVAAAYGCKCMAFDGSVEATTYISITTQLNGWGARVQVYSSLVSNDTNVSFNGWNVQSGSTAPANATPATSSGQDTPFTTASVRLDDVVKMPVLFMKVDVEGWEPSVFESAAQLIAQTPPPYVFFEITFYLNHEWRPQYIQTLHYLHKHGYRCALTHERKPVPKLTTEPEAAAWFETLKASPFCDTKTRHFCQEEVFCVYHTTSYIPNELASFMPTA